MIPSSLIAKYQRKLQLRKTKTQDTDAGTGSRAADNGHRGPKTHMPRCTSPIMLRSHQNTSAVTTPAGALVSPEEQYGRHKRGGGRRAGGGVADRERRDRLFSASTTLELPNTRPPRGSLLKVLEQTSSADAWSSRFWSGIKSVFAPNRFLSIA